MSLTDIATAANISNDVYADSFYSRSRVLPPELRLLETLLLDAINIIERRSRKDILAGNVTHARTWIDTDGDEKSVFCFPNVCEALGVSHTTLRRRLRESYPNVWSKVVVALVKDKPVSFRYIEKEQRLEIEQSVATLLRADSRPMHFIAKELNLAETTVHAIGKRILGKEFLKQRRRKVLGHDAPHPGATTTHCTACATYYKKLRRHKRRIEAGLP